MTAESSTGQMSSRSLAALVGGAFLLIVLHAVFFAYPEQQQQRAAIVAELHANGFDDCPHGAETRNGKGKLVCNLWLKENPGRLRAAGENLLVAQEAARHLADQEGEYVAPQPTRGEPNFPGLFVFLLALVAIAAAILRYDYRRKRNGDWHEYGSTQMCRFERGAWQYRPMTRGERDDFADRWIDSVP